MGPRIFPFANPDGIKEGNWEIAFSDSISIRVETCEKTRYQRGHWERRVKDLVLYSIE